MTTNFRTLICFENREKHLFPAEFFGQNDFIKCN